MPKAWKFLLKSSDTAAATAAAIGTVCLGGGFTLTAVEHAPLWANPGFFAAYFFIGASMAIRILATRALARNGMVYIASSASALRSRTDPQGFVRTENLKDVSRRFERLTEAQRELLFRDSYYGKWIRLSGEVVNVASWTGSDAEVKLRVYSWRRSDATLKFSDEEFYRSHLTAFNSKKTYVTVLGQIVKIAPNKIIICSCKILDGSMTS